MSVTHPTGQPQPQSMRPFFIIWTGQALSLLGSQLVQFALVWWLIKTTGSAMMLALASLAAILPQVLIGPFAGVLVDRWHRKTVMLAADSLVAAATLALAALFWFDLVETWTIYLLLLVRAAGAAFHWPAMQASTTLMVPEKHLAHIGGLNQGLAGLAIFLIGLSPREAFLFALALVFGAGFLEAMVFGLNGAIFQAIVPPEMQGRIFALVLSLSQGLAPLGLLLAGPTADTFGVQTWWLLTGLVIALMGAAALFFPAVVHIEDLAYQPVWRLQPDEPSPVPQ